MATITACGLAALVFIAVRFPWHERSISTDPGEWQSATLADGSELQLGPNTLLRVDLGEARRSVVLERGEAYFRVTKDPARPLSSRRMHSRSALSAPSSQSRTASTK